MHHAIATATLPRAAQLRDRRASEIRARREPLLRARRTAPNRPCRSSDSSSCVARAAGRGRARTPGRATASACASSPDLRWRRTRPGSRNWQPTSGSSSRARSNSFSISACAPLRLNRTSAYHLCATAYLGASTKARWNALSAAGQFQSCEMEQVCVRDVRLTELRVDRERAVDRPPGRVERRDRRHVRVERLHDIRIREPRPRLREQRVARDRLLEQCESLAAPRSSSASPGRSAPAGRGRTPADRASPSPAPRALLCKHAPLERRDHRARDLVLHGEDIRGTAIEGLGPEADAVRRLHELRGDAQLVAGALHTALEHRRDAERAADIANVHVLAAERERRRARRDVEPRDASKSANERFSNAVAEVLASLSALRSTNGKTATDARPVASHAVSPAPRRANANTTASGNDRDGGQRPESAARERRTRRRSLGSSSADSARTKSPQLGKRSAGDFDSARSTAASIDAGTAGRALRTLRGVSVMRREMIICAVAPVCGGSPVSISYVIAASAY